MSRNDIRYFSPPAGELGSRLLNTAQAPQAHDVSCLPRQESIVRLASMRCYFEKGPCRQRTGHLEALVVASTSTWITLLSWPDVDNGN
jgi:hypothetical protein